MEHNEKTGALQSKPDERQIARPWGIVILQEHESREVIATVECHNRRTNQWGVYDGVGKVIANPFQPDTDFAHAIGKAFAHLASRKWKGLNFQNGQVNDLRIARKMKPKNQ